MKKSLAIAATIAIISIGLPNITQAAWWNPFTWKIFSRAIVEPAQKITTPATVLIQEKGAESKTEKNSLEKSDEILKLKKENEELREKIESAKPATIKTKPKPITPTKNLYPATQVVTPKVETWEELEPKEFINADRMGLTGISITNDLGEKRYYRKDNGTWVRKNSEAEASPSWEELETKNFIIANQKGWVSISLTNYVGDKRYYRKENGIWVRKSSYEESIQSYTAPATQQISGVPPSIYQHLDQYIAQQNAKFAQMEIELKPLNEKWNAIWDQIEKKCHTGIFIPGQTASECRQLNLDASKITEEKRMVMSRYGIDTGSGPTIAETTKLYLPSKQYWQINSGPNGQGTITSVGGGHQLDYNCDPMGQCMISGY